MENTHPPETDDDTALHWHPAFVEAIKLELEQYAPVLQFIPEYQLTMEPLRIDVVIIKKPKEVVITIGVYLSGAIKI